MSYIGSKPATSFVGLSSQSFTGGSGTSFTLNKSVSSTSDIAVFVNNVRQNPTNSSYSVSGTTLTMSASIASSDSFYVVFLGATTGTVNPQAGSVGTSQLIDGSVSVAKLSATGTASSSTFLRGDNTFAEAGGGKVLQVVQNWDDQYATYSNTSIDAQATVLSQAITPSATTSKVLIQVNLCVSCTTDGNKHFGLVMYRGSTEIGSGDKASWNSGVGETHSATEQVNYSQPDKILTGIYLDSPNTTSATTYNMKSYIYDFGSSISAKTLVVNGGGYAYNNKETVVTSSSITLMEIGA